MHFVKNFVLLFINLHAYLFSRPDHLFINIISFSSPLFSNILYYLFSAAMSHHRQFSMKYSVRHLIYKFNNYVKNKTLQISQLQIYPRKNHIVYF